MQVGAESLGVVSPGGVLLSVRRPPRPGARAYPVPYPGWPEPGPPPEPYLRRLHVADLADDAIDRLVGFWQGMRMEGEVEIIGLGGAIGDVPEPDTAFSNRGYLLWLNLAMRWDDPAEDADYISGTHKAVADLAPWVGRGAYVNILNVDELDRVVEAFGGPDKYAKLARIQARYDQVNLFRMNYNIPVPPLGPG